MPADRIPERLPALTALRFFAALYVVVFHTAFFVRPWLAAPGAVPTGPVDKLIAMGFVSVSFFFLLSGYILAHVYLGRSPEAPRARFYRARLARVYPLFALTALLDVPFLLAARMARYGVVHAVAATSITLAATLAMLQAWSMRLRGIDDPNWSLAVETVFYLIFPFVAPVLWRLGRLGAALGAVVVYLAGQGLVLLVAARMPAGLAYLYPPLHVSTFLLGILLARCQVLRRGRSSRAERTACLGFAAAVLGLAVAWLPRLPHASLHDGLLAPAFACVLWALADGAGPVARLLRARWLTVLGEASFGLYLVHFPVLHAFLALGVGHGAFAYAVYLAACIGLSVASFFWFEAPARRWVLAFGQETVHRLPGSRPHVSPSVP